MSSSRLGSSSPGFFKFLSNYSYSTSKVKWAKQLSISQYRYFAREQSMFHILLTSNSISAKARSSTQVLRRHKVVVLQIDVADLLGWMLASHVTIDIVSAFCNVATVGASKPRFLETHKFEMLRQIVVAVVNTRAVWTGKGLFYGGLVDQGDSIGTWLGPTGAALGRLAQHVEDHLGIVQVQTKLQGLLHVGEGEEIPVCKKIKRDDGLVRCCSWCWGRVIGLHAMEIQWKTVYLCDAVCV